VKRTTLAFAIIAVFIGSVEAQLSTNATTFPSYNTGVYTTTIKVNAVNAPQTNAIVKVASQQVFKCLSAPFGCVNWPIGGGIHYDQLAISLDGTNYTIVNMPFNGDSGELPVIAGPAFIKYIHNPSPSLGVAAIFMTYSLYPSTPIPVIHY